MKNVSSNLVDCDELAQISELSNLETFAACRQEKGRVGVIEQDIAAARRLGGTRTPTLLANDRLLRGSRLARAFLLAKMVALGSLAIMVSCLDSDDPPADTRTTPSVADSSGIRVVPIREEVLAELPRWTLSPRLAIGVPDGDEPYLFGDVVMARRTSRGGIVVFDNLTREIRLFDRTGRHLRTAGGSGDGPGEFRGGGQVRVLPADSLIVYDGIQRRVTLLDPTFNVVSSFRAEFLLDCPTRPWPVEACGVRHVFSNHHLLGVVQESIVPAGGWGAGWASGRQVLIGLDRDGSTALVDSVTRADVFSVLSREPGHPPRLSVFIQMYGGTPHWAGGATTFALGRSSDPEIRIRDVEGRLVALVRFGWRAPEVASEDVDRYLDFDWEAQRRNPAAAAVWLDEGNVAPVKPFYDQLIMDQLSRLWIRLYEPPVITPDSAVRRWIVVDLDKGPVAVATFPWSDQAAGEGRAIQEIGEGWVLSSERSADDVPRVVLYELSSER